MSYEKAFFVILIIAAGAGLAWSASMLIKGGENDNVPLVIADTPENYERAVRAELSDKCKTPDDYTDEEWMQHMSHHPDRYKECLTPQKQKLMIEYKNIGPDDLVAMLKKKDFDLIDVHIPEQAHIPGTDKFIPFNEIVARQDELPQDKDAKIVLYCRSGSMSQTASETLLEMGYTNVYNLAGGINGWKKKGYEVEDVSLQ